MIGILATDDLHIVGHSLFKNFRLGLQNYFDQNFIEIRSVHDLDNIDTLFIVDEHFAPNVDIWKNDTFINKVNSKKIKTVVFNFEKIFSSKFPWNEDHQRVLTQIQNLTQIVSDVNDANKLGKNIINKQLLSRSTELEFDITEKKNRVLFIGQSDKIYNPSYAYSRRYQLLNKLSDNKSLPIDIVVTDRKFTYKEYLTKLASYKFILNPLGTGDFLNLRFYETLKVGSIPIQQITSDMQSMYKELDFCHTFTNADDLYIPEIKFKQLDYYLEDYFNNINLKSLLIK